MTEKLVMKCCVIFEYSEGLVFLPTDVRNLPANCFVASEAVAWIMCVLQGEVLECDALEILQVRRQQFDMHWSDNFDVIQKPTNLGTRLL